MQEHNQKTTHKQDKQEVHTPGLIMKNKKKSMRKFNNLTVTQVSDKFQSESHFVIPWRQVFALVVQATIVNN